MEVRKVQLTGGSSYIITLPKHWIKANSIKKNDSVALIPSQDGSLIVKAGITHESDITNKLIPVDDNTSQNLLYRLLISSYIMGYNIIEVKSKKRISIALREKVTEFIEVAIGPEIVDEKDKSIVIKDLLNPTEMPFENTISRLCMMVKTHHEDAIESIIKGDKRLIKEIIARDVEVDRLQWLVIRQYHTINRQPNLLGKMKVSYDEALFYFLISRNIERIGDHAVTIAKYAPNLYGKLSGDHKNKIKAASDLSLEIFDGCIKAWFKKDIDMANNSIESVGELKQLCDQIASTSLKKEKMPSTSVGYIAESIRRTGEYSANISEHVLNHLINTT